MTSPPSPPSSSYIPPVPLSSSWWGITMAPGCTLERIPWSLAESNRLVMDIVSSCGGSLVATLSAVFLAWGSLPEEDRVASAIRILLASQDQLSKAIEALLSHADMVPRLLRGLQVVNSAGASVPFVCEGALNDAVVPLLRGGIITLYKGAIANAVENFLPLDPGASASRPLPADPSLASRVRAHLTFSGLAG